MLTIYDLGPEGMRARPTADSCEAAVWIDLLNPSKAEEASIEAMAGVAVPTREEMAEIEVSSRLYVENGAHFMTATILYAVELARAAGDTDDVHPDRQAADHRALCRAARGADVPVARAARAT